MSEQQDDPDAFEKFVVIADKLIQEGALDEPGEFVCDPSWDKERYMHASMICRALANGIMSAIPWDDERLLPQDFDKVMAWIKFNVRRVFGDEAAIKTSLTIIMPLLRQWLDEHRSFAKWGKSINLEAIIRNSMLWLKFEIDRL